MEEDVLWKPDYRENHADVDVRIKKALDEVRGTVVLDSMHSSDKQSPFVQIFATDSSTVISITAHDGVLRSMLATLSHLPTFMPVAGVIPVLVQATV